MTIASTQSPFVTAGVPAATRGQRLAQLMQQRLADYAQLCRPRIAVLAAVAVSVGFTLALVGTMDWPKLAWTVIGITCFVAASSTLNQVFERRTDREMNRTSGRPLVTGRMSSAEGWLAGTTMALTGSLILGQFVDALTCAASLFTMLTYVFAYTPLKRVSTLCTTVGAIPGAMPPVLGWFAGGGQPGPEALALFALFFVWQFPHFLAIGWIYRHEYRRAGLKMLPSFSDGGRLTGLIALSYAIVFVPVSVLPRYVGLAGTGYLAAALVLSIGYLVLTARFCFVRSDQRARQLLVGSLLCLPSLLVGMLADFLRLTL